MLIKKLSRSFYAFLLLPILQLPFKAFYPFIFIECVNATHLKESFPFIFVPCYINIFRILALLCISSLKTRNHFFLFFRERRVNLDNTRSNTANRTGDEKQEKKWCFGWFTPKIVCFCRYYIFYCVC